MKNLLVESTLQVDRAERVGLQGKSKKLNKILAYYLNLPQTITIIK
jgi:hypothetical protein